MYNHTIDQNNLKALVVARGLLAAAETGYMGEIDHTTLLEIICDYLQLNDKILSESA